MVLGLAEYAVIVGGWSIALSTFSVDVDPRRPRKAFETGFTDRVAKGIIGM